MKLLVDENISWRVLRLIEGFSDSEHVTGIKEGKVTDLDIWHYAKKIISSS
jgi:predicted nuclease of predicted toxin-antitoxin system